MSDPDEREPEETNQGEEPREEKPRYDFVPYEERPEEELYSFRQALGAPPQQTPQAATAAAEQAAPPAEKVKKKYLLAFATIGCLVLAIIAIFSLKEEPAPPPPYVNLGSSSVTNSGLSSDLVARWTGKAGYVFYVNPLTPDDLAGFAAVAANPPRQISFTIHLKDGAGITVCEKEIVFPFMAPLDGSAVPTQGPPQWTMDGDPITYDRGDRGEIVRIEVQGPMNCAEKYFTRIAAWDFTSTYPVRGDQNDWVQNLEKGTGRKQMSARRKGPAPVVNTLPAPIDGDDVIVGDNPSRGTVLTRAGREFFVGPGGLSSHGEGWGFFPAAIHFHCDVKSNCTLTRPGAINAVPARLMK